MPAYGTFSKKVKARARKLAGFDDESVPRSISVKEYFQDNKRDVPKAVSVPRCSNFLPQATPTHASQVVSYLKSLFPFLQWLPRYNLTWLTGDLIA